MNFKVKKGKGVRGEITIPGDKSISHRSIMCASLAEGKSRIYGFLEGEDCLATKLAFKDMGIKFETNIDEIIVHGSGLYGLKDPQKEINLGNSGTSIRLLSGILSAQKFSSTLIGDESLSSRPMKRIIEPLSMMGANIKSQNSGRPPLKIGMSEKLNSINYELPIASAQVKSCILFASLYSEGKTTVRERQTTRNHTEIMFKQFGVPLSIRDTVDGRNIEMYSPSKLKSAEIDIPGDFSSAAFFILAALIIPNSNLTIKNVGMNETRIALLNAFQEMGAEIDIFNKTGEFEPRADLKVKFSKLKGINLDTKLVPNLIDELPAFFVAAAMSSGSTAVRDAEELRNKESDRLEAMGEVLRSLGVDFKMYQDGIDINGLDENNTLSPYKGGIIESFGDHRIAMSSAIACSFFDQESLILNTDNVNTSFPAFLKIADQVGLDISLEEHS
ncbi:3-phosphoshikimate 1-carboxyvinyltransferase [SAR86 cluster bacterium]|nr:3-phosphoshikimate 1-carboxyvinyltransferase [SAR86 cluster bacterium]